ncbi:MAG: CBS domain-containing protein [Saprospiraceae bacterium]|nr:CBS domain-containing protein [Saprospiraceae bacterium]
MGEQRVHLVKEQKQMQRFMKALLNDVRALEYMIENDWFENDIVRIGAEQEMVLVHKETYKPATVAMEALELMKDLPWVETELAKFNLETNLTPREFSGTCFSDLHKENAEKLNQIQEILNGMDVSLILTGILPTLRKYHLIMDNLTPKPRYYALMDAINAQHLGPNYELRLEGLDELIIKHDSPLIEACNTSFQVHLQVPSHDFVHQYNIAQAITAPILAISANSPLVFGKRLWHESRIALFQQALDTRSSHDHMRERSPRVTFGKQWLSESSLDIYKEDISRFRVLLGSEVEEESLEMIRKGQVPKLRHLQVHNSTVYRWNRPCYGISDNGKPHLRIECRVIPAGPTVADEVANGCFWLGLMSGMTDTVKDIRTKLSFDDVSDNFLKAAKFGIDSKFNWYNDKKVNAIDLINNELIDIARHGLRIKNVAEADIDLYLGIISERAKKHMTGARWLLKSYTDLKTKSTEDEALSTVTAMIMDNQISGKCVHDWDIPQVGHLKQYKPGHLLVSEFMTTDLFTVQEDDIVDLVAELMDWKNIRYVPVEDKMGKLSGLVSTQLVIRNFLKKSRVSKKIILVKDLMIKDPVTIMQNSPIIEAMDKMQLNQIGCLPVVKENGELVGIVTETDFLRITSRLLSRLNQQ